MIKSQRVVKIWILTGIFLVVGPVFFVASGIWIQPPAMNLDTSPMAVEPVREATVPEKIIAATTPTVKAADVIGKPIQLMIPTIGVDANVLHLGLTKEGAVAAPEGASDVSWFTLGSRPGQQGSAVISGHYGRWKNGTDSVFNRLPELQPGDVIFMKDDEGTTRTFVVEKTRVYGKDEVGPEIFTASSDARLNIITCHGTYLESEQTYNQRLVVFAKLQ